MVAILALWGCGSGPKGFTEVDSAVVWHVTGRGVQRLSFTAEETYVLGECLARAKVVPPDTTEPLLPESYLLEVSDRHGTRSLELASAHLLRGAGATYRSDCVYTLVANAGP